jgi:hypothetical protein
MKPTPSLFMFPQAISIHRYFTPEAASEAGLGEPEQFSPGSVVVNVIWPDSISGYYEETPERTFMCTVFNESEIFAKESECVEWLYSRVKHL